MMVMYEISFVHISCLNVYWVYNQPPGEYRYFNPYLGNHSFKQKFRANKQPQIINRLTVYLSILQQFLLGSFVSFRFKELT